jgi:hypothetical protein
MLHLVALTAAPPPVVSVEQLVAIGGGFVALITALIFDWPARVWKAVLRWRGRLPIATNHERPEVERLYATDPVQIKGDPNHEGARCVVLDARPGEKGAPQRTPRARSGLRC